MVTLINETSQLLCFSSDKSNLSLVQLFLLISLCSLRHIEDLDQLVLPSTLLLPDTK
jgi:hypothetical protein